MASLSNHPRKGAPSLFAWNSYFTVQRSQIIWYTTHIPAELLNYYQSFIPILKEPGLPGEAKPQPKVKAKKESDKIIPFPLRKDQGG